MKVSSLFLLLVLFTCSPDGLFAMGERAGNDDARITRPSEQDSESISRGRKLFDMKCSFCHNAYSTEMLTGPGLKGILKNKDLPVSRRSATTDNIIRQLKQPFDRMPSFDDLTEGEIRDVVSFLSTL